MPCTGRDRGPRQQGAVTEDGRPPSSPLKSLGVGVSGGEGAGWEEARNRPWQAEWGHRQRAEQTGGAAAASQPPSLVFSDQGHSGAWFARPGRARAGPPRSWSPPSDSLFRGTGRLRWGFAGPKAVSAPQGTLECSWVPPGTGRICRFLGELEAEREPPTAERSVLGLGLGPWWNHRPRSGRWALVGTSCWAKSVSSGSSRC